MHIVKQLLRRYALLLAALLLGMYAIASSLWELGNTAFYLHKSVVLPGIVTDVRQRPFDSLTEAWHHGNLCSSDATAYQAYVSFTLPAGITINKAMPDLDCEDYTLHQTVEIITHPHDPNQAHIYKAQFLCGRSLLKLIGGLILFLPAFFILRKRRKSKRTPQSASTPATPQRATNREPEDFTLVAPEPAPAKKRRSRKQPTTSEGEKKAPSKRKKSSSAAPTTRRKRAAAK